MTVLVALLVLAGVVAGGAPRLLSRAGWPEREPVLALWMWQCAVATVLIACVSALALSLAAAWEVVRGLVFAFAPRGVEAAYGLGPHGTWAALCAVVLALGGVRTAAVLARVVRTDRAERRRRRADLLARVPLLPGEDRRARERLVVLEGDRAGTWWLPGAEPQFVITTAALRRLSGRQLDALIAHERGHARARHHWLQHCSSALAEGFPGVPVFAAFRSQVHRLVELAADDAASRRHGRLTTALALAELNADRGVFGPRPGQGQDQGRVQEQGQGQRGMVPQRVDRLLAGLPRLPLGSRLRVAAVASLVPVVPLLVALGPGLLALVS